MKLGNLFKGGNVYVALLPPASADPDVQTVDAITAALFQHGPIGEGLGSPLEIHHNLRAALYQDDDAHDTCTLTACLNPLHPGPCKGWKGVLHETSPGAWHALEAARVEKANKTRVAKIESLKAKGLPIPKSLLTPIVAKKHPNEGKTAKVATGEAHAAGKAVSDASGVHTNEPGKVSLGQASKTLGPVEKGPKGKKPTLASKGVAFVIAQEKVTPQYKLDKAEKITPEQWNDLSAEDKKTIRDELTKIKKDGFGPQQKKASILLGKLPAEGKVVVHDESAKPKTVKEAKADGTLKKAADEVAAKATPPVVKTASEPGENEGKPALPAPSAPKEPPLKTQTAKDKLAKILEKHKAEPPKVAEVGELKPGTPGTITTPSGKVYQKVELKKADEPKPVPAHVQHAIDMAHGKALGASWSKNHLAAYEKLSAEEFHALDKDTQGKIRAELSKGATKFLDPKKIQATKDLLEKFKATPASKIENKAERPVGFHTHLHDHSVSQADAKAVAAATPLEQHYAVAQKLADLKETENPDTLLHKTGPQAAVDVLVDHKTKFYSAAVKDQPDVKAAITKFKVTAWDELHARSVGQAKKAAYDKVSKKLLVDDGPQVTDKLSPIEKASLKEYQKHLLNHPFNTTQGDLDKLNAATKAAEKDLDDKLAEALKKANAPSVSSMTDAQLNSKAKELLGSEVVDPSHPKVNLTLKESQEVSELAEGSANSVLKKYPAAVLTDPAVAAKQALVKKYAKDYLATELYMKPKLQDHIKQLHDDALKTGEDVHGNTLSADDKKAIEAHKDLLEKQYGGFLNKVAADQLKAVNDAKAQLTAVADKVNAQPHEPAKLSEYDEATINEVFTNAWSKHASKAVTFGSDWTSRAKMKTHSQYPLFTQDLGDLKTLAGKVAVAHAQERIAELNAPTDPDTGVTKLGTPEGKAWLDAITKREELDNKFAQLHKKAQAKLDTIRTNAGLKKRSLPKLDANAVKTTAAESAFYKTAGYGGPNYGKQASAKSYLPAKVGDKLGVKHQSASEKKAEKLADQVAKSGTPGKVTPSGKYVPPPTSQKTKDQFPSASEAGSSPTQSNAEKYGFHYEEKYAPAINSWPGDKGGAYVTANPEHLDAAKKVLQNEDLKSGMSAQTQFKWSINNMEGKGSPTGSKGSLYNYTGSGYSQVNSKLNSLPPGAKTSSKTISNIDKGMAASPAPENDLILYRGFKDPHSVFSSGKWNDVNVAGMEWSQRSYSSTSGNLSTAQSFAGYSGVVMRVIVPKEMQVKGINAKGGQHPGEAEVILERGLRYRVVADHGKHGNQRYIDVMVVPSPYDKPE